MKNVQGKALLLGTNVFRLSADLSSPFLLYVQAVLIWRSTDGTRVSRHHHSSVVTVARAMKAASEGATAARVINSGDNIIEQERNKKRTDGRRK